MNSKELKSLNDDLKECFLNAGERAIYLRGKGLKTEIKNDNTPVTNGDLEVNEILTDKIKELTHNIPIVSEESSLNKNNSGLSKFWLIDPIDGTYDYINNRDEFTLNAALIVDKAPFLGIVYAPSKKRLFYTYGDKKSFEINEKGLVELKCNKITKKDEKQQEVFKKPSLKVKEKNVAEVILPDLNLKTETVIQLFKDVDYDLRKVLLNFITYTMWDVHVYDIVIATNKQHPK